MGTSKTVTEIIIDSVLFFGRYYGGNGNMSCNEFGQNEKIFYTKIIDCNVESIVTTSTLLQEAISFASFHS